MKDVSFGIALSFCGMFFVKRAPLSIPYVNWFTKKIKRINPDFELRVAYGVVALGAMSSSHVWDESTYET